MLYASLLSMISEASRASTVKIATPTASESVWPLACTFVNTGRLHAISSALVVISKTVRRPLPWPLGFGAMCPIFWIESELLQLKVG